MGQHPISFRHRPMYFSPMNHSRKWSAVKLAVLLGTVSVSLTGCFIWRDHDHDRDESPRHEDEEHHDDQDRHDNHDHHDGQDHP
jgi:ABC-type nickel/cobalt efflux system permease component RcnA